MKRLRTRLILAFCGVAILSMILLSLIPFLTLKVRNRITRTNLIDSTSQSLDRYITNVSNDLSKILFSIRHLQQQSPDQYEFIRRLEEEEGTENFALEEKKAWFCVKYPYDRMMREGEDLKIIPLKQYNQMREWIKKGGFYEDEEGKIYLWAFQEIKKGYHRSEMKTAGGILAKTLFIQKHLDSERAPSLIIRQVFEIVPRAISPRPSLLQPYLLSDQFERLFDFDGDGIYEEVDVDWMTAPWLNEGAPTSVRFKPIVNQRGELTALLVIAYPVISVWKMIGMSMVTGLSIVLVVVIIAALLFARSIAKPIKDLASAAEQIAQGNFDVRVRVWGAQEQIVLSESFNQMADRIKRQMAQLQQQTQEMEEQHRALAQTHRFLENILSSIHTGVMSLDRECKITLLNQAGQKILRIRDYHEQKLEDVSSSSSLNNLIRYALDSCNSIYQEEIPYQTPEGGTIPLQVGAVPILQKSAFTGLVVTFHDLSDIRKLEEQIRRQDRLAALGRMAAGVAHEIRNPLGIIRGSAEILKKRFGDQSKEEGLSDFIIEEVNRLSRVVTDFLLFARPPVPSLESIEPEALLDEILVYAEKLFAPDRHTIEKEIAENLPAISVDPSLCRQAFLNLLLNAQQSMPDGGVITLRALSHSPSELVFEVIDRGIGIQPEDLDRIFDPFYTSKDTGTGLGLSLVHQIVSSHGGRIETESKPGKGAVFRLIFPICESTHQYEIVESIQ